LPESFFEDSPDWETVLGVFEPAPLRSEPEIFDSLMGCIVEQQHPLRSTKKVHARLLDSLGLSVLKPHDAEGYIEMALKRYALSESKIKALAGVLESVQQGHWRVEPRNRAELGRALGPISGIGEWTLQMIEVLDWGEPDVFPERDFHLARILSALPDGPKTPAQLRRFAERWTPRRSLAARVLWGGSER
jgi:DNA-3-methyladenine glycosylase II